MSASTTKRASRQQRPGIRSAVAERPEQRGKERPGRGKMDITLFFLILVLLSIGLVMVFSASYATSLYETGNSLDIVLKQGLFVGTGIVIMIIASFFDYRIFRKFRVFIYWGATVLMVAALFFKGKGDAHRWIRVGGMSFQPSEIMKFALIVMFAHLVANNYKRMDKLKYGLVPFALVLIPIVVLMGLQRHMSGLILMVLIGFGMMFVGGSKIRWFLFAGAGAIAGGVGIIVWKGFGYIQERLATWLDPFENIRDGGWQITQSLYAIGSGGLMGVGLGNSTQKYLYVSEPQNDFIFCIICEELGLLGAVAIILLFVLFVYCGFSIAMRAPDKFGCMLAVGLTLQIGIQALLNIAVVTNAMPTTGISLPFFSAGGTATIMQLAQMGVLLNISRFCLPKEERGLEGKTPEELMEFKGRKGIKNQKTKD